MSAKAETYRAIEAALDAMATRYVTAGRELGADDDMILLSLSKRFFMTMPGEIEEVENAFGPMIAKALVAMPISEDRIRAFFETELARKFGRTRN